MAKDAKAGADIGAPFFYTEECGLALFNLMIHANVVCVLVVLMLVLADVDMRLPSMVIVSSSRGSIMVMSPADALAGKDGRDQDKAERTTHYGKTV